MEKWNIIITNRIKKAFPTRLQIAEYCRFGNFPTAEETFKAWAEQLLSTAAKKTGKAKNMFDELRITGQGKRSVSRATSTYLGKMWVGSDYLEETSQDRKKSWVSKDRLKRYRPPYKKTLYVDTIGGFQSNFEWRAVALTREADHAGVPWDNDIHLDVDDK